MLRMLEDSPEGSSFHQGGYLLPLVLSAFLGQGNKANLPLAAQVVPVKMPVVAGKIKSSSKGI